MEEGSLSSESFRDRWRGMRDSFSRLLSLCLGGDSRCPSKAEAETHKGPKIDPLGSPSEPQRIRSGGGGVPAAKIVACYRATDPVCDAVTRPE